MPEGPSIVIVREESQIFTGKKVLEVSGNTKQDKHKLLNKKVVSFRSWGKHFLICFDTFYVKIHFMLFGSYRINEEREGIVPRLQLKFSNGSLSFYACSIKIMDGSPDDVYDWKADVMSDRWKSGEAFRKIEASPKRMVCDILMDQEIFSGVGNIIKNEVLWRKKIHPESNVQKIPPSQIKSLITDARRYSFLFYEWKKIFQLKKHWKIYRQKLCPRCELKVVIKPTGKGMRRSFFCRGCQVLYR